MAGFTKSAVEDSDALAVAAAFLNGWILVSFTNYISNGTSVANLRHHKS